MKHKITFFSILFLVLTGFGFAQTTAMDFDRKDCNGVQRHLFADLDSGNVVIIEFFMINCSPCPAAGQKLEVMKSDLLSQYPGKIISYAMAFNNTYSQATVNNWVTTNGFTSIPMDSGATQVAYYGGMGMPTIVILGGKTTHSVLGAPYTGFNTSDTTIMASDMRTYLNSITSNTSTTALTNVNSMIKNLTVFPNPSANEFSVSFDLQKNTGVQISLYDIQGKHIKDLETIKTTGNYNKRFSLSDVSTGNYFIKVKAGEEIINQKISIVR